MIKVTALTANKTDPTSRFRFRQYIEPLAALGVEVTERYLPITRYRRQPLASLAMLMRLPGVAASRGADITWLRRELIPERVTLERFTGGRRLFDVDDAIWLQSNSNFSERIVAMCDGVIAGNRFLAQHYEKVGKPVWIVPTAVDTDIWLPAAGQGNRVWTVGWIGSRSNLRFLTTIEAPIAAFLGDHPDAHLRVVCDRAPVFTKIPPGRWDFVKWSAQNEIEMTQTMDAGLMPLDDSDWSRGKCGFKTLQYMSVGLPVIISPVGVNQEILDLAEIGLGPWSDSGWYDALKKLYIDRDLGVKMGLAGRKVVEEHYSVRQNALKLARIFREVAEK